MHDPLVNALAQLDAMLARVHKMLAECPPPPDYNSRLGDWKYHQLSEDEE